MSTRASSYVPDVCGDIQGDVGSNCGIDGMAGVSLLTRLGSLGLVGRGAMHTVLVDTGFIHDPAHRGAVQGDVDSNYGIDGVTGVSFRFALGPLGLSEGAQCTQPWSTPATS